jgi:hypothetical protein
MTLIDDGAADLFPDARTAALAKNGAPHMFSDVHVPTAADTKDDHAACLYPSVHTHAASHVKNGRAGHLLRRARRGPGRGRQGVHRR